MATYLLLGYSAIANLLDGLAARLAPAASPPSAQRDCAHSICLDALYGDLGDIEPDSSCQAMLLLEQGPDALSMEILRGDHEVFPLQPYVLKAA